MCSSISKDPRFAGAYTGNTIDAQPENYGSRAIDLEQFLTVLAEGIEEHNTRVGRRSEVAFGRSFADVFDESYTRNIPKRATEAQRRFWLLGAEGLRADRNTGAVWFQGNEFWAEWMQAHANKRVVIRFDPENFMDGVHVYSADNAYLGHAPVRQKVGFFNMDEARAHARARGAWMKAQKAALAAQRKYTAAQVGQSLEDLAAAATERLPMAQSKVVRAVFGKGPKVTADEARRAKPVEDISGAQADIVADLNARRTAPIVTEETARDRFRRALDLERIMAAGDPVTREQERWLSVYQTSAEYMSERQLWDDYGDTIFA